jgi:hypothetical protein
MFKPRISAITHAGVSFACGFLIGNGIAAIVTGDFQGIIGLVIGVLLFALAIINAKDIFRSNKRERILREALADIANNLGRGTMVPSSFDNGSRPLRVRATETLKQVGYIYKENPDGWYEGNKLIIPM